MILKFTLPCLLCLLCLSLVMSSHAAETTTRQVTVIGTATKDVTPNLMHWRLKINNQDADLKTVAESHSAFVKGVLDYLKKQQIPEKDIQTSGMLFGENWVYQNRNKVREGFMASTDISFKLTKLSKYQELWMGLSKLPNTSLTSVHYDHSERIAHESITRKRALLDAKEKATAMAETLNSTIGKPILIEEQNHQYPRHLASAQYRSAEGAADNSSLAPGQIPITIRVKVSFQIE